MGIRDTAKAKMNFDFSVVVCVGVECLGGIQNSARQSAGEKYATAKRVRCLVCFFSTHAHRKTTRTLSPHALRQPIARFTTFVCPTTLVPLPPPSPSSAPQSNSHKFAAQDWMNSAGFHPIMVPCALVSCAAYTVGQVDFFIQADLPKVKGEPHGKFGKVLKHFPYEQYERKVYLCLLLMSMLLLLLLLFTTNTTCTSFQAQLIFGCRVWSGGWNRTA